MSFDPNVRKEMLFRSGMQAAMECVLKATDLFLPSGEEPMTLTGASGEAEALERIFEFGASAVVHKLGHLGARYHDRGGNIAVRGYAVQETDPTGAGDCFGGAFTSLWLRDTPPETALKYAAAAGAIAVTKRGPMEGTSEMSKIEAFIAQHEVQA